MLIVGIIYVSVSLDTTREIAMVLANCNYKAITKLLCCQTNLSKTSTLLVYDGFRYFKLFFFFENPTGCVLLLLPIVHKASIRIQILQQEYKIMEIENEIINSVDNCTGPNPTESIE